MYHSVIMHYHSFALVTYAWYLIIMHVHQCNSVFQCSVLLNNVVLVLTIYGMLFSLE